MLHNSDHTTGMFCRLLFRKYVCMCGGGEGIKLVCHMLVAKLCNTPNPNYVGEFIDCSCVSFCNTKVGGHMCQFVRMCKGYIMEICFV